jgi:hypothetical protein
MHRAIRFSANLPQFSLVDAIGDKPILGSSNAPKKKTQRSTGAMRLSARAHCAARLVVKSQ